MRIRDFTAAIVWGLALAVASFLYTLPVATFGAALGAFLGYGVGIALEKSRVKFWPGMAMLLLAYGLAELFLGIPQGSGFWSTAMGSQNTYVLTQVGLWFTESLLAVTALRFFSGRYPAAVSLEVITVALIMASPLAAHRHGFINRPYFLVDPLWSQNQDPIPVLLLLGALAAGTLVILALGRRTKRASVIDLILLLALIGGLYLALPERVLRDYIPEPKGGGMGLKGKPKDPSKGQKGKDDKPDDEMRMDKPPPQDQEQKQSPIAVVLLRDDYDPPLGYYYFRQNAFSQFNGQRLVADTTGKFDVDLMESFPTELTKYKSAGQKNSAAFKTIKTFVALIESHQRPFALVDPDSIAPADNPDPGKFVRAFDAESNVITAPIQTFFNCQAGNPEWKQEDWKHYTEYPSNDPRYKALADKIEDGLDPKYNKSALARAVAIKLYLDKTVTYTFKADHSGAEDAVADYLFVNPRGYCVHQAHAAVYLMRAAGLPARVGVGYATDARNRAGGSTVLLRNGEAHAWPEVYLDGVGWFILDISPEKVDEPDMKQPDPGLQRLLGEMARKQEKKIQGEKEKFDKVNLQLLLRRLAAIAFWAGLVLFVIIPFIGIYGFKYYRRFEPLWCGPKRLGIAALRSALDQLAEVGEYRRYGESRAEFARRVGYESLIPLTDYHNVQAYGRGETAAKLLLQLRESLHKEICQRHPAQRRLLGFLNPITWMWVR